jgi:hypothetical protein
MATGEPRRGQAEAMAEAARMARAAALTGMAGALALAFAVGSVAASRGAASARVEPLDGKSFPAVIGEKGKPASAGDVLTFEAGKVRSKASDAHGFGDAVYTTRTSADGVLTWEAETTSAGEGRMRWWGTVRGAAIEGGAHWTRPGQAPIEYWFASKPKS